MRIKTKMLTGATLLALFPALLVSVIIASVATSESGDALREQVEAQLVSVRESKKAQIESYFMTIQSQLTNLAQAPEVQNTLSALPAAFHSQVTPYLSELPRLRQELSRYYTEHFGREYANQNAGAAVDDKALLQGLSDAALVMQYLYIQANSNPLGAKNGLASTGENTLYDMLHTTQHPFFNDFVSKFGYYDLFLVDNDGYVVYSVFKEVDFATNLKSGPFASSGLARAFHSAMDGQQGSIAIEDYAPYRPSYDGAASFAAVPVFKDGRRLGVLVLQMPIATINAIMTSGGNWQEVGLGASGETYLIGGDRKARSISRFLLEDSAGYAAMMRSLGTPESVVKTMLARESNIGLQEIDTVGTRAALSGETGFQIFPDYRDVPVLSAYAPLAIPGLNWALMSEIDEAEAFASVERLSSHIIQWALGIGIAVIIAASFVGLGFSISFTRPILGLAQKIAVIERDADLSQRVAVSGNDEIADMARSFNGMVEKLHGSMRDVSGSTTQLAAAAEELSAITLETNRAIEMQRSETDQVATAMNEMSATVSEVAKSASQAAGAARDADNDSQAGRRVVQDTIDTIDNLARDVAETATVIQRLEQESESIGAVLDVIRGIAEQTNLLALNAAIEAARAGEQGRGFAVVADEVRTLASRTQDSTQEIQSMIERLQAEARRAVSSMEQGQQRATMGVEQAAKAGQSLQAITSAITAISDMNNHIASAAEQQSAVSEEINRNIINITQVADQNSENASQTSRAGEELAHLAAQLQTMVAQFKI